METLSYNYDYILATNDNQYVAKEVIRGSHYTPHIAFALTYNTPEHARNVADKVNAMHEKNGEPTRIVKIIKREVTYSEVKQI